jgi:PAS domain S-box-containing protein
VGFWGSERARDGERLAAIRKIQADEAAGQIQQRLAGLSRVLRGAASFLSRGPVPSRLEWRSYVRDLELTRGNPGILGLAYAPWVRGQDRSAFEAAIRAQGFQSYRIVPGGPLPPEAEGCGPILYTEPSDQPGELPFGRDLWGERARREILVRARDTGLPALAGPVDLYGETSGARTGVLFCAPVYQGTIPPETVDQRRRALRGWVCCPIRLADWMRGVLGGKLGRFRVRLEDRGGASPALIFDSEPAPGLPALAAPGRRIQEGGRVWELRVQPARSFQALMGLGWHGEQLAGGVLGSVLLAWLVGSMVGGLAGAEPAPEQPEPQDPWAAADFSLEVAGPRSGFAQGAAPGVPEDPAHWFQVPAGPGTGTASGLVQALWESEERFRTITQGMKDYLEIIDGSGRVTYRNRVPAGMSLGNAIGGAFTWGLDPEFAARAQSALEACRWTGQETVARGPGPRLDGSQGWFEIHLLPVPETDPAEVVLALALDRTEAKLAENALRESEARLRAVVEHADEAIFIHDLEGRFLFCNEAACRSTGFSREELLDMGVAGLASPFQPELYGSAWHQLKAGQQVAIPARLRSKGGGSFPVEVRISLLGLGPARTILGVVRET